MERDSAGTHNLCSFLELVSSAHPSLATSILPMIRARLSEDPYQMRNCALNVIGEVLRNLHADHAQIEGKDKIQRDRLMDVLQVCLLSLCWRLLAVLLPINLLSRRSVVVLLTNSTSVTIQSFALPLFRTSLFRSTSSMLMDLCVLALCKFGAILLLLGYVSSICPSQSEASLYFTFSSLSIFCSRRAYRSDGKFSWPVCSLDRKGLFSMCQV